MMLVIERKKIDELVQDLAKTATVIIPVRETSQESAESVFEQFIPGKTIDFNYLPTLRSAKEFFFPSNENTFVFDKRKNQIETPAQEKSFILFGLNQRDLGALTQLDEIMTKPNTDFFYFKKRKMATVIGLINEPVSASQRTPSGGDLILLRVNDEQYEAIPLTDKGRVLTKKRFFKEESALVTNAGAKSEEIMPRLKQLLLDPEFLADAIKWSWRQNLAIWDELATRCLGCGICTYVCPLCYCFSIEDKVDLDGKTCTRCRQWDACTLPKFSQISGGFNFHKTIKERYYNWFFHKFVRAYNEYGKSQCVACGRCQKYCPAKIDIEKYLIRIVENYKQAMGLNKLEKFI